MSYNDVPLQLKELGMYERLLEGVEYDAKID